MSLIDPIPDRIPIIGRLDDLVFIPVGAWLTYRLTPEVVLEESGSGSFFEEVETVGRLVGILLILRWGLIGVLAWALLGDLVQTFRSLWPG